jgi:hypothetical protein
MMKTGNLERCLLNSNHYVQIGEDIIFVGEHFLKSQISSDNANA